MIHDNDNDNDLGTAAEDRSDAELGAMLAAADDHLLAAIRRGLNLDVGLTQIIGAPPLQETSPSVSACDITPSDRDGYQVRIQGNGFVIRTTGVHNVGDVSSRIARLRSKILDVEDSYDSYVPSGGAPAALLRGAASNLGDLNRGLDARELTRVEAGSLLSGADRALKKASEILVLTPSKGKKMPDTGDHKRTDDRRGKRLTHRFLPILIMPLFGFAVAALIVMPAPMNRRVVSHVAQIASSPGMVSFVIAIFAALVLLGTFTLLGRQVSYTRIVARGRDDLIVAKVRGLRAELKDLRPGVMRLFDDADDFSSQCAPLA